MKSLETLLARVRRFGLRRSIAIYLAIVIGLVLASELMIEHFLARGGEAFSPFLYAFAIAALVGVFVFFLFHGAVEDRERAANALRVSEERFRSLTSMSADWFWESDDEHRLSWIAGGQPMLKLFGTELAYGRRFWEIPGLIVCGTTLEAHLAALAGRMPFRELELCRPGASGVCDEYHLISGEPRLDDDGRFIGYRGVGRDITELKRAGQALSDAKERLDLALQSGELAIWDSDLPSGRMFFSEGWAKMLGEPACEQRCGLPDLLERVHIEDREGAMLASRRAVKAETASFSAEVRIGGATGNWQWVVMSGRVVERQANGRAVRMTGTVVSVDARKRAQHALRDAEARYRALVDLSPNGVLLHSDGRIEYANRAAAEMLGTGSPAGLFGRNLLEIIHADDIEATSECMRYLQTGPGASGFRECRMRRGDGSEIVTEFAGVSYLDRRRLVVQTVLRDITGRARARNVPAQPAPRHREL